MAIKTYFFKDVSVSGFGSLSETDPGASTTGTGWVVAKTGSSNFSTQLYGTERAANTFSGTDGLATPATPSSGDSWRSEVPVNGTFANANWTITANVRAVTASSAQRGRIKVRTWKSANADGTSGTQLTSSLLTGSIIPSISTSADNASTITWSPGSVCTLTFEYFFLQVEWEITTASGSNSGDIDFRASSSTVATSTFSLGPITGALTSTEAADTLSAAAAVTVGGTLTSTEAADTLSSAAGPIAGGALSSTEAADTLSATAGPVVGGTLSSTEATDTLSAAGTVADNNITGDLNSTEAADTLASTATVSVSGTLTSTEAADTLSSVTTVSISGALTSTEAADTLSATAGPVVAGTLSSTEGADTLSASCNVTVSGVLSAIEASDILVAAGGVLQAVTGTLATTEDPDTLSATGTAGGGGTGEIPSSNSFIGVTVGKMTVLLPS
jgi:hypothetical protein